VWIRKSRALTASLMLVAAHLVCLLNADVSKEIEAQYKLQYENKAMFLKIPVRGEAETVSIRGDRIRLNTAVDISKLRFRVGEQIRITSVDFKDSHVEFEISSIDSSRQGKVLFRFPRSLTFSFPERPQFDRALESTFTEGLSYQQIEEARTEFIKRQFDEQVREYVSMTGASMDLIMKAVAERNPQFRSMRERLSDRDSRIEELTRQLESEQKKNRDTAEELRGVQYRLVEAENENRSLKREVNSLTESGKTMSSEIETLRRSNREFQKQINEIAEKLNLETDSRTQLDQQVSSLSRKIESLSRERDNLSSRVRQLLADLESSKAENEKLSRQLQSAERQARKLRSDLNALTSNRNSLESSFIRTKNEMERLQLARKLEETLRVRPRDEEVNGKTIRRSEIYLGEHRIAVLEAGVPGSTKEPVVVRLMVDSPDTVQFTEEERNLYQALGERFRLRPAWDVWSGELEFALAEGEEEQAVGPREEVRWVWNVSGEPETEQPVSLVAHLIDEDDLPVFLTRQDFRFAPSGLISGFASSFSLGSMTVGLLIGFVGVGAVAALRGGSSGNGKKKRRVVKKQIQKEL